MERRKFIAKSSLVALSSALGTTIVFGNTLPENYKLLAFQEIDPFKEFDKNKQMVILNDKPWNIEAQAHLLADPITPNASIFIRNNGKLPANIDAENWTITFDGESVKQKKKWW